MYLKFGPSLPLCSQYHQETECSFTEVVFVMTKTNYKVYAGIGMNLFDLRQKLIILFTGAGWNFVRLSAFTTSMIPQIRKGPVADMRDSKGCSNLFTDDIYFCVHLSTPVHR